MTPEEFFNEWIERNGYSPDHFPLYELMNAWHFQKEMEKDEALNGIRNSLR